MSGHEDSCLMDGHAAEILSDLQCCVAEHSEISVEHSTFRIEPAAHHDQEKHPPLNDTGNKIDR